MLAWSGGKDSVLALQELKSTADVEISFLLTTYNADYGRVFMHGVRMGLIRQQADALGIPLVEVGLGKDHTNEEYGRAMLDVLLKQRAFGVSAVAFGDIFLEDLRRYREENPAKAGMDAVFPLWRTDTTELARRFIQLGYKAVVTCADLKFLGGEYVGREYDDEFLLNLPENVDPCGENGEFHTFVYDGPLFRRWVGFTSGGKTLRDGRFWYCELEDAG